MGFQLSKKVVKNKVFLVKRSELEGRLDCEYYRPVHYEDLRTLREAKYPLQTLKDVCTRIVDGPFGSTIKAKNYVNDGVPFIRVADVTHGEGTIKTNALIFISNDAHKAILRSKIAPGDIVIAKTGATMGAASVVPQSITEGNIRGDLAALSLKNEECRAEYTVTFINTEIGQRLFWRLDSGGTRGRVVIGNLKKYPIITPPLDIQLQIVAQMDGAYAAKKEKEAEAQRLLDSIDDYLLQELGIELPEEGKNTIQERMFFRKFSEVSGGRFDAPAHRVKFSLESSIYQNVALTELAALNPATNISKKKIDIASFIPMNLVSDVYGEADETQAKRISESKGYTLFQNNDLIWAKITPCMENGKSAVVKKLINGFGFGSTEFHVFREKEGTAIDYLYGLLRMKIVRTMAVNFFTGSAGHQRVDELFFHKLFVPRPPLPKQHKIAAHIQTIRNKAKQLRSQAASDLEQAKQEVEAMILGEANQ